MDVKELLARAGDQVGVHRVFGEPIERDGVTVIPVAMVMGGGGGGIGPIDPSAAPATHAGGSGGSGDASGGSGGSGDGSGDGSGGSGDNPGTGLGAGFGVWARAIGVYEIREGRVRFVPALDVVALGVLGLLLTRTVGGALRRARRRR